MENRMRFKILLMVLFITLSSCQKLPEKDTYESPKYHLDKLLKKYKEYRLPFPPQDSKPMTIDSYPENNTYNGYIVFELPEYGSKGDWIITGTYICKLESITVSKKKYLKKYIVDDTIEIVNTTFNIDPYQNDFHLGPVYFEGNTDLPLSLQFKEKGYSKIAEALYKRFRKINSDEDICQYAQMYWTGRVMILPKLKKKVVEECRKSSGFDLQSSTIRKIHNLKNRNKKADFWESAAIRVVLTVTYLNERELWVELRKIMPALSVYQKLMIIMVINNDFHTGENEDEILGFLESMLDDHTKIEKSQKGEKGWDFIKDIFEETSVRLAAALKIASIIDIRRIHWVLHWGKNINRVNEGYKKEKYKDINDYIDFIKKKLESRN